MGAGVASRFYVARWSAAGAFVGAALVLVAWQISASQSGPLTFAELHQQHPVMWIVDLLPSVLGVAGLMIGALHRRLVQARQRTEELAKEIAAGWTADLHEANRQLAVALHERQRFYAAVSHEMRTPLTAIVGYSDLTEELAIDPTEVGGYLSEIYGAAASMLDIVNDLLDAAKLETGGITLQVDDIDGDQVVTSVATRLTPLAKQKGVTLRAEPGAGPCRADPGRLRQILTNLVANAVKFTDVGQIVVRSTAEGESVRFDVIDQGPGLEADDLERIFRPFVQTAAGESRSDSTGLGLTISQTFARAMGGRISAASEGPGRGSTFSLWLPKGTGEDAEESRILELLA